MSFSLKLCRVLSHQLNILVQNHQAHSLNAGREMTMTGTGTQPFNNFTVNNEVEEVGIGSRDEIEDQIHAPPKCKFKPD